MSYLVVMARCCLREIEAREPRVTLLYSVRDPVHNHAAVLTDFLSGLDS